MRIAKYLSVAFSLAALAAGCDGGNPSGPSEPSLVVVQNVVVIGPHRIVPGQSGKFTATAEYSDGSKKDVTNEASWSEFDSHPQTGPLGSHDVLAISPGGEAKSRTYGQSVVYAWFGGRRSAPYEVLAFEEGTFAVWGTVTNGFTPLHASVDVISGNRAGLFVWSNYSQGFVLYGVSGPLNLRISSDGFQPQTREVTVSGSGALSDLDLPSLLAPAEIGGSWILTVNAPASCQTKLPESLRTRSVRGRVIQGGTFFTFNADPTPSLPPFGARGRLNGNDVTLSLAEGYDYTDYDWAEKVDSGVLTITAALKGPVDASGIAGAADATFSYYASQEDFANFLAAAQCTGADGAFVMTRR